MRERPILFSSAMVKAILAGTKSQTRRLLKSPHVEDADIWSKAPDAQGRWESGLATGAPGSFGHGEYVRCPYGVVGDRLWVRESFYEGQWTEEDFYNDVDGNSCSTTRSCRPEPGDFDSVHYVADGDPPKERCERWVKKPAIHMPRWASRITLEVAGVRVERLQAISAADAVAEGVIDDAHGWDGNPTYPLARFRSLWIDINGEPSWSDNPWVWVVAFRRVDTAARAA